MKKISKHHSALFFVEGYFAILITLFLVTACTKLGSEDDAVYYLQSWQFHRSGNGEWMAAHVPGSVMADLWRNRKINAISHDQTSIINHEKWEYRTVFNVPETILQHEVIELCFDGLSTFSTVILNDSIVLNTNSRLLQWKVNCKKYLKSKGNHLIVLFEPSKRIKSENSNKKDLPGTGISRSVYLYAWSVAHVKNLYFKPAGIDSKRAEYQVEVAIQANREAHLTMDLVVNNKILAHDIPVFLKKGENTERLNVVIEKPRFWWPNGMGNQNLYNIQLVLKDSKSVIQTVTQHLGIRTIELVQEENKVYFKVNGYPLFIKGAGYVPENMNYPGTGNYEEVLESAHQANFNMIRLQQGQVYENDRFYDLCDEKGLLVWQDFIIPCVLSDSVLHTCRKEAEQVVIHLRNHASMALWSCKDSIPKSGSQKPYARLFSMLADVVAMNDPHTTIKMRSSMIQNPDETIEILNGQMEGSLVTGYGIPAFGAMKRALAEDSVSYPGTVEDIYNDVRNSLQNKELAAFIRKNYGTPRDFESEVYLNRLAQADIMKSVIENNRLNMPYCMGSVYDRINDSRAGISSSTVSFSGWWKPSHYVIKNAFSHFLVVPVRDNGMVKIYVCSDALKEMDAILLVKMIDFEGTDLFVKQMPVEIPANSANLLLSLREYDLLKNTDKKESCLIVQLNQANKTLSQNILYFTEPKNLNLSKSLIDIDVNEAIKGFNLILKSPVLTKNVFIETISRTAWFNDNNIDLLPGKRTRISVTYPGTKNDLLRDIRIRSLIDTK